MEPRVPDLSLHTSGTVGLYFPAVTGRNYRLQRTVNMTDWPTLTEVAADSFGNIHFNDPSPPPGKAFYRLAEP